MTRITVEEQIFACDPVKVAVQLFHGTERNRHLWGWYCRTMGRDRFRDYVYQKYCENKEAGMPRNPAAAFQAMLSRALPKRQTAAVAVEPKASAAVANPVATIAKSFSAGAPTRTAEERQQAWERKAEMLRRQLAAYSQPAV